MGCGASSAKSLAIRLPLCIKCGKTDYANVGKKSLCSRCLAQQLAEDREDWIRVAKNDIRLGRFCGQKFGVAEHFLLESNVWKIAMFKRFASSLQRARTHDWLDVAVERLLPELYYGRPPYHWTPDSPYEPLSFELRPGRTPHVRLWSSDLPHELLDLELRPGRIEFESVCIHTCCIPSQAHVEQVIDDVLAMFALETTADVPGPSAPPAYAPEPSAPPAYAPESSAPPAYAFKSSVAEDAAYADSELPSYSECVAGVDGGS